MHVPSTVYVFLVQEISRLAGQLRRLYGSNKKAARPFHLFLTDLREDSRVYRECIRMNDGFVNYMVIIVVHILNFAVKYVLKERRGRTSPVKSFGVVFKVLFYPKTENIRCTFEL